MGNKLELNPNYFAHVEYFQGGIISAMQDKLVDLTAVLPLIRNNQTIALGGMTIYRRPVAFVRALLQYQA